MDFVWQYAYDLSFYKKAGIFNEIEYSIKSVRKNFPDCRCFVVGDDPGFDTIHIQAPPQVTGPNSEQPQHVDKINKMTVMANHPEINEEFVLMYDDIYLMKPTTVEDLKINWARQEVANIYDYVKSKTRTGDRSYKNIWSTTYEYIKMIRYEKDEKTYDWETHTPRYLEKTKLRGILKKIDPMNPMIVTALYDGYYAHNTKIINTDVQTDIWTHTPGMDFEKLLDVQYLNIYDNVIVPEFINQMKKLFG